MIMKFEVEGQADIDITRRWKTQAHWLHSSLGTMVGT